MYNCRIKESVPFYFYIKKGELEYRKMGLMNPYAQILSTKFMDQYDKTLIDFFNHNKVFSIRTPIGINCSYEEIPKDFTEELSFILDSEEENTSSYKDPMMRNYFCLSKFPKLTDFYRSYNAKDKESKYKYLRKLDFQNCFGTIYTHSLDWAYLGSKEVAKDNMQNKARFSAILDIVAQRINYNETNGIIVGPEFSRTIAELLLTRLDNLVVDSLRKEGIYFMRDYDVVRFIDDIFIFYNNPDIGDKVSESISREGLEFRMTLNNQKSFTEIRPFFRKHMWISQIKDIIPPFLEQFSINEATPDETITTSGSKNIFYSKSRYDNFFEKLKLLIINYEDQKRYIVSYAISVIENNSLAIARKLETSEYRCVEKHIAKLIDLLFRVVNYNISADNIIKISRIMIKLQMVEEKFDLDAQDIIYTKSISLIKYNLSNISELLNLIIVLSFNHNLIPAHIIDQILSSNKDYFTISTVAYYISSKPITLYEKQKYEINRIIASQLEMVHTRFNVKKKDGYRMVKSDKHNFDVYDTILLSEYFYIIHDFYTCPIISEENKLAIEKIKNEIHPEKESSPAKPGYSLYNLFLSYVTDFDKPFMRWFVTPNELKKEMLIMKYCKINQYS